MVRHCNHCNMGAVCKAFILLAEVQFYVLEHVKEAVKELKTKKS